MAFTFSDLKLPADKLAQMNKALGGSAGDATYAKVQDICDEAAAEVARLTTGYTLDDTSTKNFVRAVALGRAYGYIGPIPADVQKNHDTAMKELTAIAQGDRPNLPKVVTSSQNTISGGWGSKAKISGRIEGQ